MTVNFLYQIEKYIAVNTKQNSLKLIRKYKKAICIQIELNFRKFNESLKYIGLDKYGKKIYVPVLRIHSYSDAECITYCCPFCGKSHCHSNVVGHRVAHCNDFSFDEITIHKRKILQKNGYFLQKTEGSKLLTRKQLIKKQKQINN